MGVWSNEIAVGLIIVVADLLSGVGGTSGGG